MPTGDLRRALRAHGHSLRPLVHIGKGGVTRGVLAQLAQTLFDHELVKVRIAAECPVDRFAVADELGAQPGTQVVQLLGRIVLVYKRHPQKPHWYLQAIGTDPTSQGRGFGGVIIRHQLANADASAVPAYLESSEESNIPIYATFGFEVTGARSSCTAGRPSILCGAMRAPA